MGMIDPKFWVAITPVGESGGTHVEVNCICHLLFLKFHYAKTYFVSLTYFIINCKYARKTFKHFK